MFNEYTCKNPQQDTGKQCNKSSKKIIYHDQEDFIPGMQGWFNLHESVNIMHHIDARTKVTRSSQQSQKKPLTKLNILLWKIVKKIGIEGLYVTRATYDTPTVNLLKDEKLKAFPLQSGTNEDIHYHHSSSTLYSKHQQEQLSKKNKKGICIGKEGVTLTLFSNHMILCTTNPPQKISQNNECNSNVLYTKINSIPVY